MPPSLKFSRILPAVLAGLFVAAVFLFAYLGARYDRYTLRQLGINSDTQLRPQEWSLSGGTTLLTLNKSTPMVVRCSTILIQVAGRPDAMCVVLLAPQ